MSEPTSVHELPLAQVTPNPLQPRKHFDAASIRELADSIALYGVLSPIVVRPRESGGNPGWQIIAGERRYRAMRLLGWETIPCLVRDDLADDDETVEELALLENCARQDMRPTETANAYHALLERGDTLDDLAQKTGKSADAVKRFLQVLRCTSAIQGLIDNDRIPLSLAGDLARLSPAGQTNAVETILARDLGVASARRMCRQISAQEHQLTLFSEPRETTTQEHEAHHRYTQAMASLTQALSTLSAVADTGGLEQAVWAMATPPAEMERMRLIVTEAQRLQQRFTAACARREDTEGGITPTTARTLAAQRAASTRRKSA